MMKDPSLRPNPGKIALTNPAEDTFRYPNNAAARNGTVHLEAKLSGRKVGIIGLGGTGSHVLDNISKTRLAGIRLFDDDVLETHNAYRGPGVVPIEALRTAPQKVEYYADIYGELRRDIETYPVRVCAENLNLLDGLDFVFLCVDVSPVKAEIVQGLLDRGIPFVDTGLGAELNGSDLTGMMRSTLVTPEAPENALRSIITEASDDNIYATNIQIIELNSITACLAVVQFKTYFGFYIPRPGSKSNWLMPIGRDKPINMGKTPSNDHAPLSDNESNDKKNASGGTDD